MRFRPLFHRIYKSVSAFAIVLVLLLFMQGTVWGQIALRGTATSATTTNTIITINKPTGVVAGDVMIVNINQTGNTTSNAISPGWTLIDGSSSTGSPRRGAVLYRVADGTEETSFTFTLGAGVTSAVGSIIAYSGVSGFPFDVAPGTINPTKTTSAKALSINTTMTDVAVIFLAQANSNGTTDQFSDWSGPYPPINEVMDVAASNSGPSVGAAWGIRLTSKGWTGDKTVTLTGNYYAGGILIALHPASGTAPTITSLGSTVGCEGSSITINGSNLTGATATSVRIGGTSVSSITSQSANQIVAVIGKGATGRVTVGTTGGTAVSASDFTVNLLPTQVTVTGGGAHSHPFILTASNGGSGTIYFQGTTSGGTSTANPSTSQEVNTTGTYYFRALSAGGCWGNEGSATFTFCTSLIPALTATVADVDCSTSNTGSVMIDNLPYSLEFVAGSKQYVDLGSRLLDNRAAFTIEGWVKTTGNGRYSLFGQDDNIEFGFTNGGRHLELYSAKRGGISLITSSVFPTDGEWHHVAATGDATSMAIYLDGVELVSSTYPVITDYGTSGKNAMIGGLVLGTNPTDYLTGQIMKVGFWNFAMTQEQITEIADKIHTYTSSEIGLIAGYNFNEGSGTKLSPALAGTNGTFKNNPTWNDPFTLAWTKTGNAGYSATTRSITALTPGVYNLSVSLDGCSKTNSWTVSANDKPTIAAISSPAALCVGTSLNPTAPTVTDNGSTVTAQRWQLETALNSGTYSNLNVPYNVAFADNGKKIRYYATNSCGTSYSNEVALTVNPLPTASISTTNSPICEQENVEFTITGTTAAVVTYNINNGTNTTVTLTGGTATISYMVEIGDGNQTLILVSVSDINCTKPLTESSTITVNPLPLTGEIIPD